MPIYKKETIGNAKTTEVFHFYLNLIKSTLTLGMRLRGNVVSSSGEEQYEFLQGYNTQDHILIIRKMSESPGKGRGTGVGKLTKGLGRVKEVDIGVALEEKGVEVGLK